MRKTLASILLSLPLCFTYADEVKLYTWEDYLAEEVIAEFEELTGHQVKLFYFDNEDLRNTTITSGRGKGYDLIIVDSLDLSIMAGQGYFQKVPEITSTLRKHMDPRWASECGEYGVPYAWGTMGIFYRSSVAVEPLHSWYQLFVPPREHEGRISMYMETIDTVAAALMANKNPPFSEDTRELKQAFELLQRQAPRLLTKDYHITYVNEHGAESQLSMTFGYSVEGWLLEEATGQEDWEYVVPDEGSLLWLECLAIPEGNPIKQATREFLYFLNRPEVAAKNAELVWISTPNVDAIALTSEEYQKDEALFPAEEVLARSSTYKRLSVDGLRYRSRMLNALN